MRLCLEGVSVTPTPEGEGRDPLVSLIGDARPDEGPSCLSFNTSLPLPGP